MTDRFGAVVGARRGPVGAKAQSALEALQVGDSEPALQVVDAGEDPDGYLTDTLAERLCDELAGAAYRVVAGPMERAGGREHPEGGDWQAEDAQRFAMEARAAVLRALQAGARGRRGAAALLGDCEAVVLAGAYGHAAEYVRRGGSKRLQRLMGTTAYKRARARTAELTDIHPSSGALAPLLLDSVDAGFMDAVCNGQGSPEHLAATAAARYCPA